MSAPDRPERALLVEDLLHAHPVHVVWEITLACNLKCAHCGSRAGKVRADELSTEECFDVVDQLARLGTREITIIGGEAYLRRDWIDIIARISSHGMRRVDADRRPRAYRGADPGGEGGGAADVRRFGRRPRGPARRDARRAKAPSARPCRRCELLRKYDIPSGCNTQIGSRTMPQLRGILHEIASRGAKGWQIQLTVAMGNAVDNDQLLMQP